MKTRTSAFHTVHCFNIPVPIPVSRQAAGARSYVGGDRKLSSDVLGEHHTYTHPHTHTPNIHTTTNHEHRKMVVTNERR